MCVVLSDRGAHFWVHPYKNQGMSSTWSHNPPKSFFEQIPTEATPALVQASLVFLHSLSVIASQEPAAMHVAPCQAMAPAHAMKEGWGAQSSSNICSTETKGKASLFYSFVNLPSY